MKKKIAIIPSHGLGDGLLWLIFTYNLYKNDYEVSVYSNILQELKLWFPWTTIQPKPRLETREKTLDMYDLVTAEPFSIAAEPYKNETYEILAKKYCFMRMGLFSNTSVFNKKKTNASDLIIEKIISASGCFIPDFHPNQSMVYNIEKICAEFFELPSTISRNGVTPPRQLVFRKYLKRVAISPLTTTRKKEWPIKHFIKLIQKLNGMGWGAKLVIFEKDAVRVRYQIQRHPDLFIQTTTIQSLASYLYESAFFIGCDSGPGHLASSLGIPILTIVIKKVISWKAEWGLVHLVKAPLWHRIRTKKYWKYALTTNRVKQYFERMVFEYERQA